MTTEHQHDLDADADQWGVVWVSCRSCNGFSQLWSEFQEAQEQQLAQAQKHAQYEENEAAHFKREFENTLQDVRDLLDAQREDRKALTQSREENERLRARDEEWTESNAQAVTRYAQARTLLEAATDTVSAGVDDPGYPSGDPEQSQCFFCGGEEVYSPPPHALPWTKPYQHTAECAWVKARAFLAQEKEPTNER